MYKLFFKTAMLHVFLYSIVARFISFSVLYCLIWFALNGIVKKINCTQLRISDIIANIYRELLMTTTVEVR